MAQAEKKTKRKWTKRKRRKAEGRIRTPYDLALHQFERRFLDGVIDRCGGNKSEAARRLGLSYATLKYRLMLLRKAEEISALDEVPEDDEVREVRRRLLSAANGSPGATTPEMVARVTEIIEAITREVRSEMANRIYERVIDGVVAEDE